LRVDLDVDGSEGDERFCLGLDGGTGVDDSADEAPAVVGLSLPLPFFFFDFLDLDGCSSEATDSASNCPGKTVGKPTTIGEPPALSFDGGVDMGAFSSAGGGGFFEFFFLPFLFAFEEVDWSVWELVVGG
jgi:hypothetical protein